MSERLDLLQSCLWEYKKIKEEEAHLAKRFTIRHATWLIWGKKRNRNVTAKLKQELAEQKAIIEKLEQQAKEREDNLKTIEDSLNRYTNQSMIANKRKTPGLKEISKRTEAAVMRQLKIITEISGKLHPFSKSTFEAMVAMSGQPKSIPEMFELHASAIESNNSLLESVLRQVEAFE